MALATTGLGIAMPSCPGQQAMQQQIDALNGKNGDLAKKTQSLETQLKQATNELGQIKQLLPQMSQAILQQKTSIDAMDATLKDLQSRAAKTPVSKPTKSVKAAPAPARKGR